MMYGMNGMMGWMTLWGLVWFVLVVGGIALVVSAISKGSGGRREAPRVADDSALSALRERFARGEISEEEYRERRRVLDEREGRGSAR